MKFLTKLMTVNFQEKFFALFITIIIWILVVSKSQETRSLTVRLANNIGNDKVLISEPVTTLHIQAKGSKFDFARLSDEMMTLKIDLSHKEPGRSIMYFDSSKFAFSKFIEITQIYPNEVVYTTAKTISKIVTIEPYLDGQPAKGYRIKNIDVSPKNVLIVGPDEILNEIETVATDKIILNGLKETLAQRTGVSLRSPYIRTTKDEKINIVINIERDIREMSFQAQFKIESDDSAGFTPKGAKIELKGPFEKLEKLQEEGIFLFVESKNIPSYIARKFYIKNLPEDIQIIKMPESVSVKRKY